MISCLSLSGLWPLAFTDLTGDRGWALDLFTAQGNVQGTGGVTFFCFWLHLAWRYGHDLTIPDTPNLKSYKMWPLSRCCKMWGFCVWCFPGFIAYLHCHCSYCSWFVSSLICTHTHRITQRQICRTDRLPCQWPFMAKVWNPNVIQEQFVYQIHSLHE